MHGAGFGYALVWMPSFHVRCQEEHTCGQRTARHTTDVIDGGPTAFSVAGPKAWNQLPAAVRRMDCVATFKRHMKLYTVD